MVFYIYKNKNNGKKEQYCITISRKYINRLTHNSFNIQVIEKNLIDKSFVIEEEDGFWTPVKEILEYSYEGDLYNLEVTGDHSYVSNYIVNHNCIAFGLCMVYNLEMFNVNVKDNKKENKQKLLFPDGLFREQLTEERPSIFNHFKMDSFAPWR